MRAYYAHPMTIYDRPQERRDLETIKALGYEPVNPNASASQAGYDREGMEYFVKLVQGCDVLVFRAFPDGKIPAGVLKEIETAGLASMIVIELPAYPWARALSVEDTRARLREGGQR